MARFITWLGIAPSKYYDWQTRYGKANEHNALIPRDFWLEDWEKKAIVDTLAKTEGNREQAAKILGIGERTLYRKIKEYDL